MANLGMTMDEIVKRTALRMGFGYTAWADLAAEDQTKLEEVIQSALRTFYRPILPGTKKTHNWSFLRPWVSIYAWSTQTAEDTDITSLVHAGGETTVTMDSGWTGAFYDSMVGHSMVFEDGNSYPIASVTSTSVCVVTGDASGQTDGFSITADGYYRMPADCAKIFGDWMYFQTDTQHDPVKITSSSEIRELWQYTSGTGRPQRAATEWEATDQSTEQNMRMLVWPVPDMVYELEYEKQIKPTYIDVTNTTYIPYGGAEYAEVLMFAIYATYEELYGGGQTVLSGKYQGMLDTAIHNDIRTHMSRNLGRNRDYTDARHMKVRRKDHQVTYNDVMYD